MKVINISKDDWSNFSYDNCQAMRSVGIDAESLKLNYHISNYPKQSEVVSIEDMIFRCMDADLIQFVFADIYCFNNIYPHITDKKINVIYAGSAYRENPKAYNNIFNPVVNKSIIALGEFAGLGAKDEVYMVGAIDVDKIRPVYRELKKPYLFAHHPSKTAVKGTTKILEMMQGYNFIHTNQMGSFEEQLIRYSKCDIYIELFNKELSGKKYGSWGISALEAAAMGKPVVTMNLSEEVYKKNYGSCPLITVQNEDEFKAAIATLESMAEDEMLQLQKDTREWVVDKHSYKATGEYIVNNIL